jgi:hypothetical protein
MRDRLLRNRALQDRALQDCCIRTARCFASGGCFSGEAEQS